MIEKSGIYGSNVGLWSERDKELFKLGRFKWAVVRTDTNAIMADFATSLGATVIMQFPDQFNTGHWPPPGDYARFCYDTLTHFSQFSHIAVLDNEPNLHHSKSGRWFAEEFCRWYRAVVACFRYLDPGSHWKLLFPGLVPMPWHNPLLWHDINRENIEESDGVAWHVYWQFQHQFRHLDFGESYKALSDWVIDRGIYITEYGVSPGFLDEDYKVAMYPEFIRSLPYWIRCACLFILGGTDHWRDWWLTERIARALGELEVEE